MGFFTGLSTLVTELGSALAGGINAMIPIFYTAGDAGAAGSPTFVGYLLLAVLALSMIGFGLRFIRSLINRIRA